jgi:hypothetical protein
MLFNEEFISFPAKDNEKVVPLDVGNVHIVEPSYTLSEEDVSEIDHWPLCEIKEQYKSLLLAFREQERELRLAAEIGQSLLDTNCTLQSSLQSLDTTRSPRRSKRQKEREIADTLHASEIIESLQHQVESLQSELLATQVTAKRERKNLEREVAYQRERVSLAEVRLEKAIADASRISQRRAPINLEITKPIKRTSRRRSNSLSILLPCSHQGNQSQVPVLPVFAEAIESWKNCPQCVVRRAKEKEIKEKLHATELKVAWALDALAAAERHHSRAIHDLTATHERQLIELSELFGALPDAASGTEAGPSEGHTFASELLPLSEELDAVSLKLHQNRNAKDSSEILVRRISHDDPLTTVPSHYPWTNVRFWVSYLLIIIFCLGLASWMFIWFPSLFAMDWLVPIHLWNSTMLTSMVQLWRFE